MLQETTMEQPTPGLMDVIDWHQYEREKARLMALCLDPADYEEAIRALCDRLNI